MNQKTLKALGAPLFLFILSCQPVSSDSANPSLFCQDPAIQSVSRIGMRGCSGESATLEGELQIYAIDKTDGEEFFRYFLKDVKGELVLLRLNSSGLSLKTGDRIRVRGTRDLCASRKSVDGLEFASAFHVDAISGISAGFDKSATTGVQNVLAILVSFTDKAVPYTVANAQSVIFDRVNRFWQESSFQKTSIAGQVAGPYTISLNSGSCTTSRVANLAGAAAKARGFDPVSYARVLYIFPKATACGDWYGLATVGGSQAWINGSLVFHTVAHELGHNLGLYHANGWKCGSSVLGSNCNSVEYADPSSAMGNKVAGHYHAYEKERLGWMGVLGTPEIKAVDQTGVYSLGPFISLGQNPGALKILKSRSSSGSGTYYYLEMRQPSGFDSIFNNLTASHNLTQGILVHMASDNGTNPSYLLNMNPAVPSWYQAALQPGQTFNDPTAGITVFLKSINSAGAEVSVTLSGGAGPNPTPTPAERSVRLSLDREAYLEGQMVIAQISSTNLGGGSYVIAIEGPGGVVFQKSGVLDGLGGGLEQFQIGSCAPQGDYEVTVTAGTGNESVTHRSSFKVQ